MKESKNRPAQTQSGEVAKITVNAETFAKVVLSAISDNREACQKSSADSEQTL